ncbi:hypothetical protein OG900_33280 [Streptomyces sp. NBC_00433]
MGSEWIDLGDDHAIRFAGWFPDRDLNPQYDGIPDVERYAAMVRHLTPAGEECMGGITFDGEVARRIEPGKPMWQVESFDPPSFSPSLLCSCGDHGFVRVGRWVRA